jgi:hypothetical protein
MELQPPRRYYLPYFLRAKHIFFALSETILKYLMLFSFKICGDEQPEFRIRDSVFLCFFVCYVTTLSVSRLCSVDDRITDEHAAADGMRINRVNISTRRKPAPVSLCPPQIPPDLTWNRWKGKSTAEKFHVVQLFSKRIPYYFSTSLTFLSIYCKNKPIVTKLITLQTKGARKYFFFIFY